MAVLLTFCNEIFAGHWPYGTASRETPVYVNSLKTRRVLWLAMRAVGFNVSVCIAEPTASTLAESRSQLSPHTCDRMQLWRVLVL